MGTAGLSTLLYLEVLDASFSFDGVIGAFAIGQNVLIIVAGLGIRALFVRSMTVQLVRREHWCSTATSSTALPGRSTQWPCAC